MSVIGFEDLVKLKIDILGNSQKCLGLKKDNITGLVTEIQKDPNFVKVENNRPSSPSIYRKDQLVVVEEAPFVARQKAPARGILNDAANSVPAGPHKMKLTTNMSLLASNLIMLGEVKQILTNEIGNQRRIRNAGNRPNPDAVRKISSIEEQISEIKRREAVANELVATGRQTRTLHNSKAAFFPNVKITYSSLSDEITTEIERIKSLVRSFKAEDFLKGILKSVKVVGGKTRRNRRNSRRTLKAPVRR